MRACDVCAVVRPIAAPWWFVTEGKTEPSEWRLAKHWCVDCMHAVQEFLAHLSR